MWIVPKAQDAVKADRVKAREVAEQREQGKKYKYLLNQVEKLEREVQAVNTLYDSHSTFTITPRKGSGTSEATAVVLASDWHLEEEVESATVNGLNRYNIAIAKQRAIGFFQGALRLWQVTKRDVKIENMVVALGGDFISGNIHDELLETCQLAPIEACLLAQEWIESGIEFLLKNTDCFLTIPCSPGNHSRITKKQRHATENGNSLEIFMYHNLAKRYERNPRVRFIISGGYHTYLKVYDMTLRFHHGHGFRYQGGVAGLQLPVYKAIAQWNKAKKADLDLFGHWHSFLDGGNFICNGSLIGYNAYGLSIKATFEKPKQAFFLIDKKRGKTIVAPILPERK